MTDNRAILEIIAPTVDEAIQKGCADLGLPRDAVEVEILDEGSKGLFGLRSRQARIRLTIKNAPDQLASPTSVTRSNEEVNPAQKVLTREPLPATSVGADSSLSGTNEHIIDVPGDESLQIAEDIVSELLEKMKVQATVTSYFGEADERRKRIPIHVDIHGQDLSILIGRQAETLNALQYISSLILGKELGRGVTLVLDVEGYRKRREQQLRKLAQKIAEQAVKTGRRQYLEPMPANERRIIHIELRDNPDVITESIGEDPRRKVSIIPQ